MTSSRDANQALFNPSNEWMEAQRTKTSTTQQLEKREWVGLTDEDIWEEVYEYFNTKEDGYYFCFAQAIEAKLREKNA